MYALTDRSQIFYFYCMNSKFKRLEGLLLVRCCNICNLENSVVCLFVCLLACLLAQT